MKVLIVEDSTSVVEILRLIIERNFKDIEVFTAESMESAQREIAQGTMFDVIYVDNDLGKDLGAGTMLLPKILEKFKSAAVFWISGSELPSNFRSTHVVEMRKPFRPSNVERSLKEMVAI